MNHSTIDLRIEYGQDIPYSIETSLLSLFCVESLDQLSDVDNDFYSTSLFTRFQNYGLLL